jgi:signal transduction histidine kinase
MRVTFRVKLMIVVGMAAFAFVLLIGASELIARRVERQLSTIQLRYLPKVELEPQLGGLFERIRHGFQDAVVSHDIEALVATSELKRAFVDKLAASRDALDPVDAAALRTAFDSYFASADGVSRRLIANETGEGLVDAIAAMQVKQARFVEVLQGATAFDRRELAAAFGAAIHAEATARAYRLWITVACLVSVTVLSVGMTRGVVRSLADLTAGLDRFGKGDFGRPIRVASRDEFEDVAKQANQMAASLDRFAAELTLANKELEAFSYSVAHDLRAPLRGIHGFSSALLEDCGEALDDDAKGFLNRIRAAADRMAELIDALLALSRVSRAEIRREEVSLSALADTVVRQLRASQPDRLVDFVSQPETRANGDAALLRALLENLLGNAWKFTGGRPSARIEFGALQKNGATVYYVRDDGAGFNMAYADKLFAPFQRLHAGHEFPGTGIGLATVQRIVHRHRGRVWAEAVVTEGATFFFTLADSAGGATS